MVAPLRSVLVQHVSAAFGSQQRIDGEWARLGFLDAPDYVAAYEEYEAFLAALRSSGTEILMQPHGAGTTLDALYTHDPALVTERGVILANMGKKERVSEVQALEDVCNQHGIPILGRIASPGSLEGGDVCWLDERTVAIGEGYRTNGEGIRQCKDLLGELVDEVIPVPLPHWRGPKDVLHLLSLISPVDADLAVVYPRLMPVRFLELLGDRGMQLVEVPDEEYGTLGCNVLALAPRRCLAVEGNPITRRRLEAAGAEVLSYGGDEISLKGTGGPTCLTRPLLRGE